MSFWQTLQDPNTQWVLMGCMLLGISSGVLGCFAFLRGRSLAGDALAHAALPGVCLAYLFTGSKSIGLFLIGAGVAGLLATYCISMITKHTRIKEDTSLALTLSVFFGIGIVLLTFIQHSASGNQSGLDKFLFGQAASLVESDVTTMIIVAASLLLMSFLFFKEFTLLTFDASFGRGLGFPMGLLDALLMLMLLMSVVIGLQAVGVVLMAAMLITPAVTARYWTNRLSLMVILSGVFGAVSGALGTLFSTQSENLPTGPMIVLAATCFFLCSLLFAPQRGLLSRLIRFLQIRNNVLQDDLMIAIYGQMESDLSRLPFQKLRGYQTENLAAKSGKRLRVVERGISLLQRRNLIRSHETPTGELLWSFSKEGLEKAHQLVLNQRLWDLYYMNEHQYDSFPIDRDNEELSSQLSAEQLHHMKQQLVEYDLLPSIPSLLEAQNIKPSRPRRVSL